MNLFPDNPILGQQFTHQGKAWEWTGVAWDIVPIASNQVAAALNAVTQVNTVLQQHVEDAEAAAQDASNSKNAANSSKIDASISQLAALASEVAAGSHKKAAETAVTDARAAVTQAEAQKNATITVKETVVGIAATVVQTKDTAVLASTEAKASADEAQSHMVTAEGFAQFADAVAGVAVNAEASASIHAGRALVHRNDAQGFSSTASSEATKATTKAGEAATSATQANTAKVAAETARDVAVAAAEQASAGQIQSDWGQTDSVKKDFIKRKPVIPTKTSELANDAGFITAAQVPAGGVASVNGRGGVVTLTKTDVGLANVDNTSDANKPVSTATQTALNVKANLAGATFTGPVVMNSEFKALGTFNINGTGPNEQPTGLYVANLAGVTGTTENPQYSAAICAQLDPSRSVALSVDASGYLYGFRTHVDAITGGFKWQSKVRKADSADTLGGASADALATVNTIAKRDSVGRVVANGFVSTGPDGLRLKTIATVPAVILRKDDSNFYLMMTDAATPDGTFNALRPFRVGLTSGDVHFGHSVSVAGNLMVGATNILTALDGKAALAGSANQTFSASNFTTGNGGAVIFRDNFGNIEGRVLASSSQMYLQAGLDANDATGIMNIARTSSTNGTIAGFNVNTASTTFRDIAASDTEVNIDGHAEYNRSLNFKTTNTMRWQLAAANDGVSSFVIRGWDNEGVSTAVVKIDRFTNRTTLAADVYVGGAVVVQGFKAMRSGAGANQLTNDVKIGWLTGTRLGLTVDATDYANNWPINVTGSAAQLGGQAGAYYLNAANFTGTLADARIPTTLAARTVNTQLTIAGATGEGQLRFTNTGKSDHYIYKRTSDNVIGLYDGQNGQSPWYYTPDTSTLTLGSSGIVTISRRQETNLDTMSGNRFFGFSAGPVPGSSGAAVGAPVSSGAADAVGLQMDQSGQRTQLACLADAEGMFIRTDDTPDGQNGWGSWKQMWDSGNLTKLSQLTNDLVLKGNRLGFVDLGNSGTAAQSLNFSVSNYYRLSVTGAFTLSLANIAQTDGGFILLELVNGAGYPFTWPAINWVVANGTGNTTTNFNQAGYTLKTTYTDWILLWCRNGSVYGKVMR